MSWLKLEVIVFMASYASIIGIFVLGRILAKKKETKAKTKHLSSEITVVVPFRNEKENLEQLVKSIMSLSVLPKEFIFVNDHSDDDFENCFTDLDYPHKILDLKNGESGKKSALELGIVSADSKFILTWDADITAPKHYFYELENWEWKELNILPVYMSGPALIPGFFAMDYQLQAQANVSLSGFYRPITASGANLLFKKQSFLELSTQRNDAEISSGDDQFLLKAIRKAGKDVAILTNENLVVETDAPQIISAGMNQRKRWLGKSAKVGDGFATIFGLWVFLVQMTYYAFAAYQSYLGAWGATILMVLIKGELDAFLATYKFQEQFNTLKVFVYQLIYPLYMLVLLFSAFNSKNSWKGRSI